MDSSHPASIKVPSKAPVLLMIALVVLGFLFSQFFTAAPAQVEHAGQVEHADQEKAESFAPAPYSVIPFTAILLGIAILPMLPATAHWWEKNSSKLLVSVAGSLFVLGYYGFLYGHPVTDHLTHQEVAPGIASALTLLKNALLLEYIPFITLLFGLFVVSGGIAITGDLAGRPSVNLLMMAIGSVLASFIGTTGAAMLLIRPLLRANARRKYIAHTVVFFIFIVCNTGGCLLPLGDPPLFLGYLKGVPFFWTLGLWPMWGMVNGTILVLYFLFDSIVYRREDRASIERIPDHPERLQIGGVLNFLWMLGIVACVVLLDPEKTVPGTDWHPPRFLREVLILVISALSLIFTADKNRLANSFQYDAIIEVAVLFIGIFVTMQAPMQILKQYGADLGIDLPWKFFWATGALSSFLDNAPTYVLFMELAQTIPPSAGTLTLIDGTLIGTRELIAVSLGAVYMGAMTYLGNGPNFMVKTIAEKANVKMPSFFGYMVYSCLILLPVFLAVTWLFLL